MRSNPALVYVAMAVASVAAIVSESRAQGKAVDYARSEGFRTRTDGLVIGAAEAPIWIGHTNDRFVYRKSVQGGSAFVLVNATTLENVRPSTTTVSRRRSMRW